MSHWRSNHQYPIMYAENCPEEPIIFQQSQAQEDSRIKPAKATPKSMHSNITYHPHIIKTTRWYQTSTRFFQQNEHQRELTILHNRIKNCKSLTQRKKDRNDPIIYPAYFIRENKRSKDARIDSYFRRVVEGAQKFKPAKHKQTRRTIKEGGRNGLKQQQEVNEGSFSGYIHGDYNKVGSSNFALPPVTREQVLRREKQSLISLPEPSWQSIVGYVVERRMFLEGELRILKARLEHYYGGAVKGPWGEAVRHLLRHGSAEGWGSGQSHQHSG